MCEAESLEMEICGSRYRRVRGRVGEKLVAESLVIRFSRIEIDCAPASVGSELSGMFQELPREMDRLELVLTILITL